MALSDVRGGINTRLATITGLRTYDKWPDSLHVPAAIVRRVGATAHTTFASNGLHRFAITVLVTMTDLSRAQALLDAYTDLSGSSSIIAALEGDATLGGNAEYVEIGDWGEDGKLLYNDVPYLAAELPIEVHVRW